MIQVRTKEIAKTKSLLWIYFAAVGIASGFILIIAMGLVILALYAQGVYMTTGNCWNFILVCK